jgi:hypothetical protein
MTHYNSGLDAYHTETCKGGNTVKSIHPDLRILQDSLDYFKLRKNPTWRSGSRDEEGGAKRLIVCSELWLHAEVRNYLCNIQFVFTDLYCTQRENPTTRHLWRYLILPICQRMWHLCMVSIQLQWEPMILSVFQSYLQTVSCLFYGQIWDISADAINKSEKIPINISARYQLMLECKIIMSMIRPILCLHSFFF